MSVVKGNNLSLLFQVGMTAVVSRHNGKFYVNIPEMDVWDSAKTLDAALEGACQAAIGLMEIMEEEGKLLGFLAHRGFTKRNGIYATSRETRRKLVQDYTGDLSWDAKDPDKGIVSQIQVVLAQYQVEQRFAQVQPSTFWNKDYERQARKAPEAARKLA